MGLCFPAKALSHAAPALAPRVARAIVNVTAAVEAGPGAPETIGRSLAVRCCGAGPLCLTERLAYPQPRARICAASPASCELHFTLPTLSLSLFSTGGLERSRLQGQGMGWEEATRQRGEQQSRQQAQGYYYLVHHHRHVGKGHERLGQRERERSEPGAEAADENQCLHPHIGVQPCVVWAAEWGKKRDWKKVTWPRKLGLLVHGRRLPVRTRQAHAGREAMTVQLIRVSCWVERDCTCLAWRVVL